MGIDKITYAAAVGRSRKYTDEKISELAGGLKLKGRVDTVDSLPTAGNTPGDMYLVGTVEEENHAEYYWTGTEWEFLGFVNEAMLAAYQPKSLSSPITVDGRETTTVESALNAINNSVTEKNINSSSSSSPVTDSAAGMVQGLTIYGRSKTSKNLLEITAESQVIYDVTFTIDKAAGTIIVNGTNTSSNTIYFRLTGSGSVDLPAGRYHLSGGVDLNGVILYNDGHGLIDTGNGSETTFDTETSYPIIIRVLPDATLTNAIFKPMLCTAEDYEADPTFEPYFEEIKSVGEGWASVRLADLTWQYAEEQPHSNPRFYSYDLINLIIGPADSSTKGNILCTNYVTESDGNVGFNKQFDKGIAVGGDKAIYIVDKQYTTVFDFVASLGDATLCYQLADPTQGNCIAVKTDDGTGIDGTMATFTTALPLRSTLDGATRDELIIGNGKAEVITRCEVVDDSIVPLAEPVTTPLTAAEISSFRSLRTYDSTTNITISDEPNFEIGYLKNSDNGQAIAEIQKDLQGQINEVKNTTKPRVYAFYVDQNDSNPATCVHPYYNTKYGCDNLFYQNAYMDYEKDEFNYGSWEDFIKEFFKPCMLAYDGHVDYYLDPDDYETKLDGGTSDIKDMTYNGNVMVQIKKLWVKRWTTGGKYYCIISDKKLDKSFKAYAHHDIKGNVLDYIYRAAYDGSYDGTRLRSISGIDYHNANALTVNKIMSNTTRQQEIDFAKANNDANEQGEGWNILHKAEWDLINDLLLLIGMSTNTQATFGNGNVLTYVSAMDTGIIATGTMDKKGLFYGKNDNVSGVKVFGFEHPWGNIWKSCLGWILSANQHLVKMTPGNEDGSTATDYNLDGTGYVATGKSITANGYISAFDGADTGFLPTAASGSATTYMCAYVWQNTAIYFALVGGHSDYGAQCGAFCTNLIASAAFAYWGIGAALSYKPLARG